MTSDNATTYPVDQISRVKRLHERGAYDHMTVHSLLDAAMLCHVSYVIDGQPYCTPTLYWREGSRLYWHGSSASRMLRNLANGEPACLAVTQLDSLVLARSGFNHSVDYRSVMVFGQARLVNDPKEKARALHDGGPPVPRKDSFATTSHNTGDQGHGGDRHGYRARLRQDSYKRHRR